VDRKLRKREYVRERETDKKRERERMGKKLN